MSLTKADYYFDLSTYAHASLFSHDTEVWGALKNLPEYFLSHTLGKIEADIPQGVFLVNPELISIGKNTIVEPGAYIKGPCWIGEECSIRHGAYIRGNVLTGNKCVIGHDTEVKNSILLDNAQAAHFAYLGDTILGNSVNLGAGTKCANLKLDHGPIEIRIEDRWYKTNLRKLGAIVGDGSQLGCNTVTNPGTLVGKSVFSYPCTNFGGFVPANSIIQPAARCSIKSKRSL